MLKQVTNPKVNTEMKERLLILISILASVSVTVAAQTPSFDLYFANNVTDVENLNEETIEQFAGHYLRILRRTAIMNL